MILIIQLIKVIGVILIKISNCSCSKGGLAFSFYSELGVLTCTLEK